MSYYSSYVSSLHGSPECSVLFQCQCQHFSPLSSLCLCTECQLTCCSHCTTQTVDTYFCPQCLNSIFSSTALQLEMRCDQCAECPHCQSALHLCQMDSAGTLVGWKCFSCQWNSQFDVSPPLVGSDVSALMAKVRESESSALHRSEIARLTDAFKKKYHGGELKDELRMVTASGFLGSVEKQGAKKSRSTFKEFLSQQKEKEDELWEKLHPMPKDPYEIQFNPIDKRHTKEGTVIDGPLLPVSSLSSSPPNVFSLSSISPSSLLLSHPHLSSSTPPSSVYPRRRPLQSKLSHRCPKCLKYVIKPGPGAAKVSFEIHHSAMKVLPSLELSPLPQFIPNKKIPIVLHFRNPLEKEIVIRITQMKGHSIDNPFSDDSVKSQLVRVTPLNPSAIALIEGKTVGGEVPSVTEARRKQIEKGGEEKTKYENQKVVYGAATPRFKYAATSFPDPRKAMGTFSPNNCQIEFFTDWVAIPAYDDITDDNFIQNPTNPTGASQYGLKPSDKTEWIQSRQLNRVSLYVYVTPLEEGIRRFPSLPLQFTFKLSVETKVPARGAAGFEEYASVVTVTLGKAKNEEESMGTIQMGRKSLAPSKTTMVGEVMGVK